MEEQSTDSQKLVSRESFPATFTHRELTTAKNEAKIEEICAELESHLEIHTNGCSGISTLNPDAEGKTQTWTFAKWHRGAKQQETNCLFALPGY